MTAKWRLAHRHPYLLFYAVLRRFYAVSVSRLSLERSQEGRRKLSEEAFESLNTLKNDLSSAALGVIDDELPFVPETDTTVRFPSGRETALFLRDLSSMTKQMVSSVGDDESIVHDTFLQPENSDVLDKGVSTQPTSLPPLDLRRSERIRKAVDRLDTASFHTLSVY
ncbi:unnamed protein product [Clavelina lepadiformis]|uniref:Uncharacterized protein n=1 Tax=Clavelina lepadiformis TaxID=159417 RepID=A0ABP0G042_CLALP